MSNTPPMSPSLAKRRRVVFAFDENFSSEAFDWAFNNVLRPHLDHCILVHVLLSRESGIFDSAFMYKSITDEYGHVLADDHNANDHAEKMLHGFQTKLLAVDVTAQIMIIRNIDIKTGVTRAANESHADMLIVSGHTQTDLKTQDGSRIASGGCDNRVCLHDPVTQTTQQIGGHDLPVRHLRWVESPNDSPILASTSWDKTLKYWDCRQPQPIGVINLPERAYAMDALFPLLVIGTAERHVCLVDLKHPMQIYQTMESPVQYQMRCIVCFPKGDSGFAVSSIEGRVALHYLEGKDRSLKFSFKCHRENAKVYPVNRMSFHPIHGTFSTAGADGTVVFWDKDTKQRLKSFPNIGAPISATDFNYNGTLFAYAASYDWSKGVGGRRQGMKDNVYIHATKDEDVKSRVIVGRRR